MIINRTQAVENASMIKSVASMQNDPLQSANSQTKSVPIPKNILQEEEEKGEKMDRDVANLQLSESEDSVSQEDSCESGSEVDEEQFDWRLCLKNIERNNVPASQIEPSDPDGVAKAIRPAVPKSGRQEINVAALRPQEQASDFSLKAYLSNRSFSNLKIANPDTHSAIEKVLQQERMKLLAKIDAAVNKEKRLKA